MVHVSRKEGIEMKRHTTIGLVAAVALVFAIQVLMAYFLREMSLNGQALRNEVAEQKTTFLEGENRFTSEIKSIQKQIDDLSKPPTVEAISVELKDKVAAEIIDRVAKVLMETPSYRELLKGDPGDDAEPPTLDDVVKAILETDPEAIHSKVAQGIWLANSEKLVEHRRLIANVAQAVYERYGKELQAQMAPMDNLLIQSKSQKWSLAIYVLQT